MDSLGVFALVFLMGTGIGFLSGLSGIGGAILLAPALVLALPRLGGPILPGSTVAALDMAQAFSAGLAAAPVYWREGAVDPPLVRFMGGAAVVGGTLGAMAARGMPFRGYVVVFLGLTTLGVLALIRQADELAGVGRARPRVWPLAAILMGLGVTFLGSLAGSSGSFLLSPAASRVLKVPFRRAVGSVMTVVVVGAAANLVGRILWGPFPWGLAGLVAIPAGYTARVGAGVAVRAPVRVIRLVLGATLIAASLMLTRELLGA